MRRESGILTYTSQEMLDEPEMTDDSVDFWCPRTPPELHFRHPKEVDGQPFTKEWFKTFFMNSVCENLKSIVIGSAGDEVRTDYDDNLLLLGKQIPVRTINSCKVTLAGLNYFLRSYIWNSCHADFEYLRLSLRGVREPSVMTARKKLTEDLIEDPASPNVFFAVRGVESCSVRKLRLLTLKLRGDRCHVALASDKWQLWNANAVLDKYDTQTHCPIPLLHLRNKPSKEVQDASKDLNTVDRASKQVREPLTSLTSSSSRRVRFSAPVKLSEWENLDAEAMDELVLLENGVHLFEFKGKKPTAIVEPTKSELSVLFEPVSPDQSPTKRKSMEVDATVLEHDTTSCSTPVSFEFQDDGQLGRFTPDEIIVGAEEEVELLEGFECSPDCHNGSCNSCQLLSTPKQEKESSPRLPGELEEGELISDEEMELVDECC